MTVVFNPGQTMGRGDLDIFLFDAGDHPADAYSITYAIYFVDPAPPYPEVLIGSAARVPVNPAVGEYYASLTVPTGATPGDYRVRWLFQQYAGSAPQEVVQEWAVIGRENIVTVYSPHVQSLLDKLRIQLRDNDPDRNYHFRPPESESSIGTYNRVFGQIWRDAELVEHLERALDWWNMMPPSTEDLNSLEKLAVEKPVWRTAVQWQAVVHACFALQANWTADEFSLEHSEKVRVYLPDGSFEDVPIGDLYEICEGDAT